MAHTDEQMKMIEEISQARQILKNYGYYVENLWHIDDVKCEYECSDEDAYDILDKAMQNDYTYEQIFKMITYAKQNNT